MDELKYVDPVNTKEELNALIVEYRKNWAELEKRKEAHEPSVDHWRLSALVKDSESAILMYLRDNDI